MCLTPARQPNISHPCNPLQPAANRCKRPRLLHTEQVRAARAAGIRVILAHECDPTLGGCEFSRFFQTTPQDLIADGLYARVAVAFHTGLHRAVSLCLLARELGAVRYRIKWALKSRGRAAVDAANLHPGTVLVFPRNSSGASSRAAPLAGAEHLARASSYLDSPFVDPPGSDGEAKGFERLSLARGQLVASGPDPYLTLQSVVRGQAASSEGETQSPTSAMGAAQHLPGALDSTDDEQGEAAAAREREEASQLRERLVEAEARAEAAVAAAAEMEVEVARLQRAASTAAETVTTAVEEAQDEAAKQGNQHHADDASVGATREALTDRAKAALRIQSVVRGKAGRADYVRDVDAPHPSIRRVRRRHIATLALEAPSWHEQELRENAEDGTRN